MPRSFYVYIASNWNNKVLYTGVTNSIYRRMSEHKAGAVEGFTKKYKVNKLLFVQEYNSATEAIEAEKRIKGWKRFRKLDLIKSSNPDFYDLVKELDVQDPSLRSG